MTYTKPSVERARVMGAMVSKPSHVYCICEAGDTRDCCPS